MDNALVRPAQEAKIAAYIDVHRGEMLDLWKRLVSLESPTEDKAAVDGVCEILADELARAGAAVRVEEMAAGNLLCADWNNGSDLPPVVFCGHMDTVYAKGTLEHMPLREADGKLWGPGVLDMKGGLVIALYALKALAHAEYKGHPLRVIFVGDEETGHADSTAAERIRELSRGAAAAMNFETGSPDGSLVVGRKGNYTLRLDVAGVAAHAGRCPEDGKSAILEMAHKVIAIQELNDLPRGLSVNVGVISGGTVVNAVPGNCRASIDIRFTDGALMDRTLARICEIAEKCVVDGCSGTLTVESVGVSMETNEKILALFAHIQQTAHDIGCEVSPAQSGGWSDANLIAAEGVPVVCGMGVQGEFNHTPHEYALTESLYMRTKLAAISVLRLA